MKREYQYAIDIAKAAIHKEDIDLSNIKSEDWYEIYKILSIGKLTGITYGLVSKLPPDKRPSNDLLSHWKNQALHYGLLQVFGNNELIHILKESRKRNLSLVVFKGLPIANLYPEPNMRFTSDADLYVTPEERPAAEIMFLELGYQYIESSSKNSVPVYSIHNENHILCVELHSRLWEDYEGEQTRQLDKLELTKETTLLKIKVNRTELTTLGYEEHLIYQMFHIIKHFALEGICLRYLTDITLYINAYINKIDLTRFWKIMKQLRYDKFCDSYFKICVNSLGLTPAILHPDYSQLEVNHNFVEDILTGGTLQDDNKKNWLAIDLLLPYFMGDSKLARTSTKKKVALLFPNVHELKEKFSYAKRHKVLLPIAWVHRYLSGVHYAVSCRIHGYSAIKIVKKAQYRLELLEEVGLVETKHKKN